MAYRSPGAAFGRNQAIQSPQVGPKGDQLEWTGAYSAATTYNGDGVTGDLARSTVDGNIYLAKENDILNVEPSANADGSGEDKWALFLIGTDSDTAITDADFTSNGLMVRTASGSYVSRDVAAGNGITVSDGNGASGNPTVAADINGLTADATPDGAADFVMSYDDSAGALKKVLMNNLPGGGGGGDSWSDPVDADIVPDADGTRDLGATATRFAETYTDALDVTNNITVGGTVDGRDVATDGTKLDGVETGADVTDAANVDAAGAVMDSDLSSNGLAVRTSAGNYTNRSIAGGDGVTVTNGDGVSGNPSVAVDTLITKVARTADATAIQSNTTLANDDTLTLAVAADKIYWFNAIIRYNSGATPDFKYAFTVPSGATILGGPNDSSAGLAEVDLTTDQTANGSASDRVLFIRGMVNTAGTAGNVVLQRAQNTSDASDTKVLINSCMMLMEM